ncbi:MAG TPA: AAA family ATPase [Solirubrobacteraceae bacterium]|nr:AAA family ATPase [Solirubrobacteraceae bacterium]
MSEQPHARELDAESLRRTHPPGTLGFGSTEEVKPREGPVGQARAEEAITFGLEAEMAGYNIFATGPVGVGKRTALEARLHEQAKTRPAAGDWVYLHNFRDARRPLAVALGSGHGRRLVDDMRQFLEDARRELAAAFESETYTRRQHELTEPIEREQEAALTELREHAQTGGIAFELTPTGVMTVPLRGGHPMTPAEFAQLPENVRDRYQTAIEELGPRIEAFLTDMRGRQREARRQLRALEREVALFAVGHRIDELKDRYRAYGKLVAWLSSVQEDVIENLGELHVRGAEDRTEPASPLAQAMSGEGRGLHRYEVNVFVANDANGGAPVVVETNPTYSNLFGRIEHQGVLGGGFVTDHRMLRAGAVHRANGGYLMLPAAEVLTQPLVWPKLKEVLRSGQIRLENLAEQYAMFPTATLSPEPIELDLKVVLVGSPALYELAYTLDEDVRKLFRVKAEFDWRVAWDDAGVADYASFLSSQIRSEGLRHFDAGAVARVVEHGGRLAESRDWLSTRFVEIAGLAAEAAHWAARDGSALVSAEHVERAIEQKVRRSDLVERYLQEMVREGTLLLDLDGERVGQVNGLSVLEMGDYAFGRPVRITASAGPGRGALVSIERETELSGHIHDKGFLTLTGYLRGRYGAERRIAMAANLTFEQSYEHIDGDSAASAELYALLSELAGAALRQDVAVTGSVNQHGELQAIGGVNEKIEGFYHACALRGLTGRQGVIIPEANVRNLMLSREVVESVRAGRFHVWSARTVEDGIELLTGLPAGDRGPEGRFLPGTLHARVEERLERWARMADEPAGFDGARRTPQTPERSDGSVRGGY